ncbi:50S ribosome-binding GTPase [Demequina sp. SYSU T00039]|uniref:50S ribosome-binding GTPase n=1 Tax=Demequina lignilytica TaxID=3051663 RepID=A0AAW7M0B5_9MICO|nr:MULTISPECIES: GTPase [unclassified Demequina]MDN4479276.1 50S ribosome-binding GTPase [Demequina sp. SYSU T00039-1]MDN4487594.1 50S ribosome-binding GTPase [Demequina sp. SYSU T00039]
MSFDHLAPRDETSVLRERVERLRSSLTWARAAIPGDVRRELEATIDRCEERLRLGIDWTVVALAGGTGSGKSTLFNALAGMSFAVPGVARPTTSEVSAAVWGPDPAQALLDWLGVAPQRRLVRAQAPEADADPALGGLILLDLPDHDSVNAHNRATVDRMIPMVDLLLWVVDPQKYADHAIHDGYLRVASDHGQPSLVVLNHVDRLTTEDGWNVARDLQRLLAEDGMHSVPVMPVSARTGQGVDVLRAELEGAVEARSVAADAVAADLVEAGRTLERALARDAEPVLPDVAELVAALTAAAGVDARAQAAALVVAGKAQQVPQPAGLGREVVERERLDWVDAASEGLPVTWRTVIDDAVAPAELLTERIAEALAAVPWETPVRAGGFFRRGAKGTAFARGMVEQGRAAVLGAVSPLVVAPTELIHQAYRNLDELTELARSEAPPEVPRDRPDSRVPAHVAEPEEPHTAPAELWEPVAGEGDGRPHHGPAHLRGDAGAPEPDAR